MCRRFPEARPFAQKSMPPDPMGFFGDSLSTFEPWRLAFVINLKIPNPCIG
jgi:hypothetical protein